MFSIFLLGVFVSNANAAGDRNTGQREKELYEKILDILALVRAGVSYNDYTKQLPDLVVLYDRYERSGGTNLGLMLAKDHLLRAKDDWDRLIDQRSNRTPSSQTTPQIRALELEIEQGQEEMLRKTWATAAKQLSTYEAEMKGMYSKKQGKASADKKSMAVQ